ncbi:unnamed protein product [Kuraishia capsulata CBS 1993]|uniref:Uncharacterized protein n=1 Tax=Kuraishia capsulata CBS 1993 TaxID=1382522 RepID=W6MMA8_9ASCO|nr:uncharacterized protein KUCA_T00001993001 [Kuraishia capsulata CBS 1993]CDK26022.1 unnamed protein product [Kuraishia capsulata CBS 1993]
MLAPRTCQLEDFKRARDLELKTPMQRMPIRQ